jgi:predicted TPR repeat methyltransferase
MAATAMERAIGLQQAGRWQEAASLYEQIARANPSHFEALYSLGMMYLQMQRFEDAQQTLGSALKINPRFAEGFCARGIVLLQMRRREEAIECFDRALAIMPDFVDALSSRATALLEVDRLEEALLAFDRVLALRPNHAISWNNRGNTLVAMRRHEEALESFEKALAIQPDLATAANNRELALLELRRLTRLSPVAVRALFDDYSPHYDKAMLEVLGYRAHEHVRTLAERVLPRLTPPWRILDLGCGTGLAGEAFKDLADGGRLDGVDLSQGMMQAARARGIYDEFFPGDLEAVLPGLPHRYDLVIAADTMVYLGDLRPTLANVARLLDRGGFFLFTVEKKDGEGWEQTSANRFRHSASYVRAEAERAGFAAIIVADCTLRHEGNEPVAGMAVAMQRPKES